MTTDGSRARIAEADGEQVGKALRAGISQVFSDQETLNKINVFPVPDGDTGTNLALTLSSVLARLDNSHNTHAGQVFVAVADAALDGARGNSGAIFAQFLQGFADFCAAHPTLDASLLAHAVRIGSEYANEAMDEPREGTMLSVIRDFAEEVAASESGGDAGRDLASLLQQGLERAEESLADTPKHLEVLRKAGVVDAGAQGFVDMLRGVVAYAQGEATGEIEGPAPQVAEAFESSAGEEIDLTHRYCTECMVTGAAVDRRKLREAISVLGSSMVVAGTRSKVKLHIHVNDPDELFRTAAKFGRVSGEKADDMQKQQKSAHALSHEVAVITDSAADLPDEELERLNIHMVPVRLHFGDRSYLDKISMTPDEFYEELERNPEHPKTSQPAPGDFRRQYKFLASHYRWVVSLHVSAAASGTWQSAKSAADRVDAPGKVLVFDSRNASVGQGLLCAYAAELAGQGLDGEAVFSRLEAVRADTRTYIVVRNLDYAVRGGRVPAVVKRVADLLRLTPVLTVKEDGNVGAAGILFGRRRLANKFARFVRRRHRNARRCRLGVGHAHCREDAERLSEMLNRDLPGVEYSILAETGPALGVHGGPGAMVVSVQTLRD